MRLFALLGLASLIVAIWLDPSTIVAGKCGLTGLVLVLAAFVEWVGRQCK